MSRKRDKRNTKATKKHIKSRRKGRIWEERRVEGVKMYMECIFGESQRG